MRNDRKTVRCGWWLALGALVGGLASAPAAAPYRPVAEDPLLEPWRWSTFPELNGLNAQCVTEGTDGRMWFGTPEGVWEFDGVNWAFHPTSLLAGNVTLCPGPGGSLLACGRSGIVRFAGGRWERLFPETALPFGEVRKLALGPRGELWAATAWGALCFHNAEWTLFTGQDVAARMATNPVNALMRVELLPEAVLAKPRTNALSARRHELSEVCSDAQGRIWFGTDGGEVLCFDPAAGDSTNAPFTPPVGRWMLHNELDGLVCGRFPSILPLRDGTVWVIYGAGSGCLNVFDGTRWQATRLGEIGVSEDCSHPIQTRDGVIWLSTRYVIYAFRDGRWRAYQKPEVPIPTARNFLLQSADGALWIGGPGTEIHRVDYQTPRWLTLRDLNFHWESPTGAEWFLHRSGRVVVHDAVEWLSYGVEDGVIDAPVALVGTRNGEVWVAGSHQQVAATARFDGQKWTRFVHDQLSWGIDWRGVLAASDGSLWFAAAVDTSGPDEHRAGVLQFRNGQWLHHHQPGRAPRGGDDRNPATLLPSTQRPEPIGKFLCVGESPDGRVWAGRNILAFHDGNRWNLFASSNIAFGIIETMFTGQGRELWIGTRQFGALRYDGREWRQFQGKGSLVANSVRSVAQTSDGSIWAATDRGFSRFDGQTWTADTLPGQLLIPHEGGSLKASGSGSLWINRVAPEWHRRAWAKGGRVDTASCEFWTVRHRYQATPPETTITSGSKTVAHPGSLSVFWSGSAPWRDAKEAQLQFSHRLDGGPWSPFGPELGRAFFNLASGRHLLEVRARDRDFNVDPTPAGLSFVVLPPVWRQGWFIALVLLLVGAACVQSLRVVRERTLLRTTNRQLAAEMGERAQAEAALRKSEALYRSFIAASPDGIAVVDARGVFVFASVRVYQLLGRSPEQELTGSNALDCIAPEDRERARSDLAAITSGKAVTTAQLAIVRQDGSRWFVEINGAPLFGADGTPSGVLTMVRDVTARRRAEEEIRSLTEDLEKRVQARTAELRQTSDELKDSQRALMNLVEDLNERSLQLEAANEKLKDLDRLKSLFIASMSHELRTPLNSIIGFSSILLSEWIGPLTGEQKENLAAVLRSGKHLLALINDVIDVTKIEAGKVEAVVEEFDLRDVVTEVMTVISNDLRNKRLELAVQADSIKMRTDRRRLLQCVLNLASNAVKFTERGMVDVRAGLDSDQRTVEIAVRDTGIGIRAEDRGKLFQPFVRLDSPLRSKVLGTGLGLYLTKKLATEVLQGEVLVSTAPGEGSRFVLRVPLSIEEEKL